MTYPNISSGRHLARVIFGGWLVVGAAAWVTGAAAVFSSWQGHPYNRLTLGDALLYPMRRETIRQKQGQALIAQGRDALRAQRWGEGLILLRHGLARFAVHQGPRPGLASFPSDMSTRLELARVYAASKQCAVAEAVLREGLGRESPGRAYLEALLGLVTQRGDQDAVVKLCDRYLPQWAGAGNGRNRRWLVAVKFEALLAAGKYEQALTWAETEELGEISREHRVRALLAGGRAEEAVKSLAEWAGRPGADARLIERLRVRALRETGQIDAMARTIGEY